MAEEGILFTDFYAQAVCGPSRAALLTGSYPIRVAEPGNTKGLHTKLHPQEITIAEVLKTRGYETACIGKWHAGEGEGQMPLEQGFDYFVGTPLFNGFTKLIEDTPWRCQVLKGSAVVDTINTVENVFIQNPQAGDWTIEVTATEVNMDVHVETPEDDQDYALVVYGVTDLTGGGGLFEDGFESGDTSRWTHSVP